MCIPSYSTHCFIRHHVRLFILLSKSGVIVVHKTQTPSFSWSFVVYGCFCTLSLIIPPSTLSDVVRSDFLEARAMGQRLHLILDLFSSLEKISLRQPRTVNAKCGGAPSCWKVMFSINHLVLSCGNYQSFSILR
ncbi:hypothetical protein J6590_050897 [Homalodisca vitripennis]|nr:hypothetical protein J6590_050897 [Homalodisca vitripennis]